MISLVITHVTLAVTSVGDFIGVYTRTRLSAFNRTRVSQYARGITDTFQRTRVSNYTDDYTRTRSSNFAGNFVGEYSRVSTREFLRTRSSTYNRTITDNYNRNFGGNFVGDFIGNYIGASGGFSRVIDGEAVFVGNYTRTFEGNYSRTFVGGILVFVLLLIVGIDHLHIQEHVLVIT